jgi:hypothetical protein
MSADPVEQDPAPPEMAGFRYLKEFGHLFSCLRDTGTEGDKAGNRDFHYDHYASLLLLYFFSPALTSLRGLQKATDLAKVQQAIGGGRVSLGSLSEAQSAFDPELLRPILAQFAERAAPVVTGQEADALRGLVAVDGTFFRALPRMAWALWRHDKKGIKAHVHFDVLKAVPEDATFTVAACSETAELEKTLKPDRLYVTDRGYHCHRLFGAILAAGSSFIGRVKGNAVFTVAQERPVSEEARRAGLARDIEVGRLGSDPGSDELAGRRVRLVWVDTGKDDEEGKRIVLLLCTDRLDLDAELVALGYRCRWWVELFFRWLKCILGCRHLLAGRPDGVAIQIHMALIASVLVSLWTGHKPTKRMYEWLCFYFQGLASEEEPRQFLADLDKPKVKKKSKFSSNSS